MFLNDSTIPTRVLRSVQMEKFLYPYNSMLIHTILPRTEHILALIFTKFGFLLAELSKGLFSTCIFKILILFSIRDM